MERRLSPGRDPIQRPVCTRAAALKKGRLLARGPHACAMIRGAQLVELPYGTVRKSHEDFTASLHGFGSISGLKPGDRARGMAMEQFPDSLLNRLEPIENSSGRRPNPPSPV